MRKFLAVVLTLMASGAYANWGYSEDTDRMTSKNTSAASMRSDNSLRLDFPYAGEARNNQTSQQWLQKANGKTDK